MSEEQDRQVEALYRRSRRERPSAQVDRRIRNLAARSLVRRRRHWTAALATAAVLVLSVSILLDLWLESERLEETDWLAQAPAVPASGAGREGTVSPLYRGSEIHLAKEPEDRRQPLPLLSPKTVIAESAEVDADKPPAFKVLSADVVIPSTPLVVIPPLPRSLDALLQLAEGLRGDHSQSGLITLYASDKLILSIREDNGRYIYKAWQGAAVIGVKVDWSVSPDDLGVCESTPVYLFCELNEGVQGFFEADRLDHVRWIEQDG